MPPFLEFQGYFGAEFSLVDFVGALVQQGADLGSRAFVHDRTGSPSPSSSATAIEQLPVGVGTLQDLSDRELDQRFRVVRVEVANALKLENGPEVATIVGVPDDVVGQCANPLAVWTSGTPFLPFPIGGKRPDPLRGRRLVRAITLLGDMGAQYAAMTVEWPLPCPAGLRADRRTYAFRDFFLSHPLLPRDWQARAERLGAVVVAGSKGMVTLSSSFVTGNPSLTDEAQADLADAAIDAILRAA